MAYKQEIIEKAFSKALPRFNIHREHCEIVNCKHKQETAVNNLPHGRDEMAVFTTGFGTSMSLTAFHCLRSPDNNCRLRELKCN